MSIDHGYLEDDQLLQVLENARQLSIAKSNDDLPRQMHLVQKQVEDLLDLRDKIAQLNPHTGEIGEGMLFQLVGEAHRLGAQS